MKSPVDPMLKPDLVANTGPSANIAPIIVPVVKLATSPRGEIDHMALKERRSELGGVG